MKSLKRHLKNKSYTRIPLQLSKTNHFELEAEINGTLGRFILDTGASNTCIDMEKIKNFSMSSEISETKAAGAGGTNLETKISKKNKIKIGNWKRKKLPIVLFDMVHVNEALEAHTVLAVDGIIGADVLKQGKAIIDYDKKVLYLKNKVKKDTK